MSLSIADEIALLSLQVERAEGCDEAKVLARMEFENLWLRYKRETQAMYDAFRIEAHEEHDAAIRQDLADIEAPRLAVVPK